MQSTETSVEVTPDDATITARFVPAEWSVDIREALTRNNAVGQRFFRSIPRPKLTRRQRVSRWLRARTTGRLHRWIHRDCSKH